MPTGTVKWFSPKKGYGFITMEDGQEVFVHYSAIDGSGFRSLEQGEKVQFEVNQGPKGLQASAVSRA
jgi:CspA family cold shock protein